MRLSGRGLRVPIGPAGSRQGCDPAIPERRCAGLWAIFASPSREKSVNVRDVSCFFSLPVGAVEGAVLDGFGDVAGLDLFAPLEIGHRARYLENAVVGPCRETDLCDCVLHLSFALRIQLAEAAQR